MNFTTLILKFTSKFLVIIKKYKFFQLIDYSKYLIINLID